MAYARVNWADNITPVDALHLNTMDSAIAALDTGKADTGVVTAGDALKVDKDSVVTGATRILANKMAVGDPNPTFQINSVGTLAWGPSGGATVLDVTLKRSGVGLLQSSGTVQAVSDLVARASQAAQVTVGAVSGNAGLLFGSAGDTNLYRSAAQTLKSDGKVRAGQFSTAQYVYFGTDGAEDTTLSRLAAGLLGANGSLRLQQYLNLDYENSGQKIHFGSAFDTNLYRAAAGVLKTDGAFDAVSYALGGQMAWYKPAAGYMRSGDYVTQIMRTAFGQALGVGLTTDTTEHLRIDTNGMLSWGPGNAAVDASLYRYGAGYLRNDGPGFIAANELYVDYANTGKGLYFGSNADTSLYRSAAQNLNTNGTFWAGASLVAGSGSVYLGNDLGTVLAKAGTGQMSLNGRAIYPSIPAYTANLNTNDVSGWYYFDPSTVGIPAGTNWGYVQVYAYPGALTTTQVLYTHGNNVIFARYKSAGAPGTWAQIYPSGGASITPPSTRIYRSTTFSIPSGTFQVLTWETAQYDVGSQWNSGSPTRLTCTMAGTYTISASVQLPPGAAGNHRLLWLKVNGSLVIAGGGAAGMTYAAGGGNPRMNVATNHRLAVGDYVEVVAFQDSGGPLLMYGRGASDAADFSMAMVDGAGPPGPKGDPGPAGASYTLPGRLGAAAQQLGTGGYANDWNAAVDNGWYMSSDAAHAPQGNWLIGQTTNHNGIWMRQEVFAFTADDTQGKPRYYRQCNAGTWGPWYPRDPLYASAEGDYTWSGSGWTTEWTPSVYLPAGGTWEIDFGCQFRQGGSYKSVALRDDAGTIYDWLGPASTGPAGASLSRVLRYDFGATNLHLFYFTDTDNQNPIVSRRYIRARKV